MLAAELCACAYSAQVAFSPLPQAHATGRGLRRATSACAALTRGTFFPSFSHRRGREPCANFAYVPRRRPRRGCSARTPDAPPAWDAMNCARQSSDLEFGEAQNVVASGVEHRSSVDAPFSGLDGGRRTEGQAVVRRVRPARIISRVARKDTAREKRPQSAKEAAQTEQASGSGA